LHPGDKDQDELPFVLVHPEAPKFHLMGWCYGHEGKQQKYWADKQRSDRPAFFVPQTDLRPIETLHVDVAMMVLPETVSEAAQ
jgi:hypothetical protein